MNIKPSLIAVILMFTSALQAQAWFPLKKTCDEFGDQSANQFTSRTIKEIEALSDTERLTFLIRELENGNNGEYYNSFLIYQSPSILVAEGVLRANLIGLNRKLCQRTPQANSGSALILETKECIQNTLEHYKNSSTTYSNHAQFFFTPSSLLGSKENGINEICDKFLFGKDDCKFGIPSFIALTVPGLPYDGGLTSYSYVTVPHEFFRISVDPELVKLSGELALHYLDLIEVGMKQGSPSGLDVYADLISFFEKQGKSKSESEDLAFLYLGVYATRGASFLRDYSFHPAATAAMVVLSNGISYLDKLAHAKGKAYAIPKQFRTTCHLGKPYHFWMAAFLSQYARRQGFSRLVSYYAPLVSGLAYDFTMRSNNRYILNLFKIKTPYDNYATMTRLDNWSRAMGAHFGMHKGKVIAHNADAYLESLFARARMPERIPEIGDFKGIAYEYNRVIQPIPLFLRLSW